MSSECRELQLRLLELMKVFHNICEHHGLRYFMLGGTLLGALRHQGFIPWDDDIDVGLPRKDYERLLGLNKIEWPEFIYVKTSKNSRDLLFPYAKIMDTRTTLIESQFGGIIGGIYMDVFPLDGAGDTFFSVKMRHYIHRIKQALLYDNQNKETKNTLFRKLFQRYAKLQNKQHLYRNLVKWMSKKDYDSSEFVGNFVGRWGIKEFVSKRVIGKPTLYAFEDCHFYGCEDADNYLRSIYGDYMKLPPIEKRNSNHSFVYLSLEQSFLSYKHDI